MTSIFMCWLFKLKVTVILVPFGGPANLRLLSYSQPNSGNALFAKTQNGCKRFGLASNLLVKKQKLFIFVNHWSAKSGSSDIKNGQFRTIFILWAFAVLAVPSCELWMRKAYPPDIFCEVQTNLILVKNRVKSLISSTLIQSKDKL